MSLNIIIALLTDFGINDAYVASMKGKIFSIIPKVHIVDISHSVQPQNINQASYLLWSIYKDFPKSTIFVCVVDPGVGTPRKIICAEGEGYRFIAPDNGVLKYILGAVQIANIVDVNNSRYYNSEVSTTFHGRDIIAPVAAHLALGVPIKEIGTSSIVETDADHFIRVNPLIKKQYKGIILHIDHFGNLITNFSVTNTPERIHLKIGNHAVSKAARNYSDAKTKKPFVVMGSTKLIEVSIKNGNAAKALNARLNQKIQLSVL